ncbi:glycosyltransferase family 90 protein [Sporormia fimetaria CBS 119925]|uniref:Glycosyltransferase family 90 protein n=1 Tax=Sporormia fimetaria CBS 119925 TaxID=1340428 RepID=A0A6A6VC12_9PLEO|nr:glycosyltransferase family 90 protein [Sporormia fimetaria CBS 119925]
MLCWHPHSHFTTNLRNFGIQISWRVVALLSIVVGLEAIRYEVLAVSTADCYTLPLLGILKAMNMVFVAKAATLSSWMIAPFVLTTATIFAYTTSSTRSLSWGLLLAIGHCLFLSQTLHQFPSFKYKQSLWAFAALCFLLILKSHGEIARARADAVKTYNTVPNHPIALLAAKAQEQFNSMIERQSKTYKSAHNIYIAKYQIEPPPEFKAWFDFAVSHASPIIDDFDTLYESLAPFWNMNGQEIRDTIERAYSKRDNDLWLCEFESATAITSCQHKWRKNDRHISLMFNKLLVGTASKIPDVKFLVNHLDEPRVMLPQGTQRGTVEVVVLSHQNTWDTLTRPCNEHQANNNTEEIGLNTNGLPFVISPKASKNLCLHPEYSSKHGILTSPTTFKPILGAVPILSTSSLSTTSDILIPSPAYISPEFQYHPTKDPPWSSKRNKIYWAGSTTGGFADQTFHFHRQRFVSLANNAVAKQHTYLRARNDVVTRTHSSFFNTLFFDVAFTRITQCSPPLCYQQKHHLRTKPRVDSHHSLNSRFVFDLDGNGISGRYYQLLASQSVVLKQTLFNEWHDDRLIPWLHYIPVSLSMEELPEMAAYLMWSETGQTLARRIAERGREWKGGALREMDMGVYLYRVLIELARLQELGREGVR